MVTISSEERRRRLGKRHFLENHGSTVVETAGVLNGLHSSDPVTVYLSARARVDGFTRDDLDQALYEERVLVRMLGMRRTLFVVTPEFASVMSAACTQSYVGPQRKRVTGYLEGAGLADDGEEWLAGVEAATLAALDDVGPATATELREIVPELQLKIPFGDGKKWGGTFGVSTRVLFLLATSGHIVRTRPRGTWISSQYRWELLDKWCPSAIEERDPAEARVELATRWLRAYGPGTLEDIRWWTGWGIGVARKAITASGAIEVDLDGVTGFVMPDDLADTADTADWVALLPSLDPTVMGWKVRDWYLGEHAGELFDRNGNAGPTVWHSGRIIGGWAQGGTGEIRIELLEPVPAETAALVDDEAHRLGAWLGDSRITPRFRTPLEKRLLA